MKKMDVMAGKIFLFGIPVVLALAAMKAGSIFSGIAVASWLALLLFLCVRLIVSGALRDALLTRLTFMKERDEREALLTGEATKATFLVSLAVLILLFFLSCLQVSVYRLPPEKAVNGKTGVVTLGFTCDLLPDQGKSGVPAEARKNIFSYDGLPLSGSSVILIMIIWQVISYNYLMRRLVKVD